MKTHKFARKPFYVDAVRVSEANINDVASWCEGTVETDENNLAFVKVKVHRPLTDRQTQAFLGDWVLFAGTGFKVYTPKAFDKSFEKVKTLTKAQADEAGIKVPHEPRQKPRVGAVGEALQRAQQKAPVPEAPKVIKEAEIRSVTIIDANNALPGHTLEVAVAQPGSEETKVEGEVILQEDAYLSEAEKDANAAAAIAEVLEED